MYYDVHLQSAEYIGICTHGGLLRICCLLGTVVCCMHLVWYSKLCAATRRRSAMYHDQITVYHTHTKACVCIVHIVHVCARTMYTHTKHTQNTHTYTHTQTHTPG